MSSMFGNLFSKKAKKPAAAEILPVTVTSVPEIVPAAVIVKSTGRVNGGDFDDQLGKELNSAAQRNDVAAITRLLANSRCNINFQHDTMPCALNQACYYGQFDAAKLLLENGADPNIVDYQGYTGFHWAAYKERLQIVSLMLAYGADFTIRNPSGSTARTMSSKPEVLALFDNHCSNLPKTGTPAATTTTTTPAPTPAPTPASTPAPAPPVPAPAPTSTATAADNETKAKLGRALNSAASGGDVTKIRTLLQDPNCNIDYQEEKMVGALNQACYYGHLEAARVLLEKGADPNLQDYQLYTPLHWTVRKERLEIIELLLDYGASVTIKNQNGSVPPDMSSVAAVRELFAKRAADGNPAPKKIVGTGGAKPASTNQVAPVPAPAPVPNVQPPAPPAPPTPAPVVVDTVSPEEAAELERQKRDAAEELLQPKMVPKALTMEEILSQHKVVIHQAESAAARLAWIESWNAMATALNTARASRDVPQLIALEKQRRLLQAQSRDLALPLHDYISLGARYGSLTAAVEGQCEDLILAEDIDIEALETLTDLLKQLKSVDTAVMEPVTFVEVETGTTASGEGADSSADDVKSPAASLEELQAQQKLLLTQAAGVEARIAWCRQRDSTLAALNEAKHKQDIASVLTLEQERQQWQTASHALDLALSDFGTLCERHAQLCGAIEAQCAHLIGRDSVDVETLEVLTELLKPLKALDLSSAKPWQVDHTTNSTNDTAATATISASELQTLSDTHAKIVADQQGLPARQEWIQRRDTLKSALAAAKNSRNFEQVLVLEKDRKQLEQESSQLALSVADYESLAERVAALHSEVQQRLRELILVPEIDVVAITTLQGIEQAMQSVDL